MVLSRVFTDAERESVIAGFASWKGTQAAYAASLGIAQGTVSKWLSGERGPKRTQRPSDAAPSPGAPTMLEVVLVPAAPVVAAVAAVDTPRTGVRLMLGDGVGLVFDALPPASWVAELATELRRC